MNQLKNIFIICFLIVNLIILNIYFLYDKISSNYVFILLCATLIITIQETFKMNRLINILSLVFVVFFITFYLPYIDYVYFGFQYRWDYSDISDLYKPINLVLQANYIFLIFYFLANKIHSHTKYSFNFKNIKTLKKNTYLLSYLFFAVVALFIFGTYGKTNIKGFGALIYLILFMSFFLPFSFLVLDKIKLSLFIILLSSYSLVKAEANLAGIILFIWFGLYLYLINIKYRKYFYLILVIVFIFVYIVLQNKFLFSDDKSLPQLIIHSLVINLGRLEQVHLIYDIYSNYILDFQSGYLVLKFFTFIPDYFFHLTSSYADESTKVIYNRKNLWGSIGGCSVGQAYSDLGYTGIYVYFIIYGFLAGLIEKISLSTNYNILFYLIGIMFITRSIQENMNLPVLFFLLLPLLIFQKINFNFLTR